VNHDESSSSGSLSPPPPPTTQHAVRSSASLAEDGIFSCRIHACSMLSSSAAMVMGLPQPQVLGYDPDTPRSSSHSPTHGYELATAHGASNRKPPHAHGPEEGIVFRSS